MGLKITITEKKDFFETEFLTREAFWNVYKPGCDDHLVLHNIRKSADYIKDLDLVSIIEEKIVGHIISTNAKVIDKQNNEHIVLCVGPISVLPSLQNKGIGAELMNYSIAKATKLGYTGMILFGNPDYYHRFGFRNAEGYKITTKDNQNFEPFMALELEPNGFSNIEGKFYADEVYTVDENQLIEFEKKFPYKEKLKTDTQLEK